MRAEFRKYHALGNDYIVLDPTFFKVELTPQTIIKICDRHLGLGSDGILYGPLEMGETIYFRIFNPDGSEAEKSGNGIRIFAKFLLDAGYVKGRTAHLRTKGGIVSIEYIAKDGTEITVNMGAPKFDCMEIPVLAKTATFLDQTLQVSNKAFPHTSCVSMGNPHCVILVDNLNEDFTRNWGPRIETLSIFPNRTNVQFVRIKNRNRIKIEIWERGAGYTLASGSSSCAAASVARRLGLVDSTVQVEMPGGVIRISFNDANEVLMTGPVEDVARGEFASRFVTRRRETVDEK